MWIRLNDIPLGNMPANQETWVADHVGNGDQFVSIGEGDWSLVREIDTEAHPLTHVVENHPHEYVVCDKDCEESNKLRNLGYTEQKGYFSDQSVFIK